MKIFEARQIREIDEYTIRHEPVASVDLMERAALACTGWITAHVSRDSGILVFVGPGNNGGDGYAIARLLADRGFPHVTLYQLQISGIISPDSRLNRERLVKQGKVPVIEITSENDFPDVQKQDVIIDALFGTGLSRPLEGLSALLVTHISLFDTFNIAIDIPSGLSPDDSPAKAGQAVFKASHTLSFEFPKRSFLFAENEMYTGEWHVLPIRLHPAIISDLVSGNQLLTHADIQAFYRKRKKFSHKGTYGHALLIAGSYGMAGAAILAAKACIRSGVGLLTTHIPENVYPIVQSTVSESIYELDPDGRIFTSFKEGMKYSAVGLGPGIGTHERTVKAVKNLLGEIRVPMVIDADGLNILALHRDLLDLIPPHTILTPHPGEFDRLAGKSENGSARNKLQIDFAGKYKCIVLLKGAYSSIALPDGSCYFNSTGNPGMATAGSGDVLTGIILSLLAQGYPARHAAMLGAFIHGLSGDLVMAEKGQQALIASDIVDFLGKAFLKFENHEV